MKFWFSKKVRVQFVKGDGVSFLSVFRSIAHAAETAAKIAAPIVQAVDPEIGLILNTSVNAAVGAEALITAPNSGAAKNQMVTQVTQSTVDAINEILASQGKKPLPSNVTAASMQSLETVLSGLNAVSKIAGAPPPVTGGTPAPNPVVIQPSV
jgi:hypothetical protein